MQIRQPVHSDHAKQLDTQGLRQHFLVESMFVADEATAMAEDEDSEEDLLPLSPLLNGLSLIEDELLMDMPILPKHDNCQSEYLQTSDVGEPEEKAKPFAALAQWRKPSPQGD